MSNGGGPSDFATFKVQVAEYANRGDWSDDLVTGFVRGAEEKFNAELRIDRMIRKADNTILDRCTMLPDDWLEMDFVRIANSAYVDGYGPIRYKPRDEFYSLPDTPNIGPPRNVNSTYGYYTIDGREVVVGGPPDSVEGRDLKIVYYAEVPVFADDTPSWVYIKFPMLYLYAALMHSGLHAIGEEDKASNFKQLVEDEIGKLNANSVRARASGSRLAMTPRRSFG